MLSSRIDEINELLEFVDQTPIGLCETDLHIGVTTENEHGAVLIKSKGKNLFENCALVIFSCPMAPYVVTLLHISLKGGAL
jgi:hypothetical protein